MKVYVYPADVGGCGYYRLIWPAMILKAQGHDVHVVPIRGNRGINGETDDAGKLVSVSRPADADVLVFQRVTSRSMIEAFKIWRKAGVAVVVDVDDDMSHIDQRNPAWKELHPGSGDGEYSWNFAKDVCANASLVTVSTDALLSRYAQHGRGVVVRNAVPSVALTIVRQQQPGTVGWGGAVFSHTDDTNVVGTSMTRIQREGYTFKVVGPRTGVKDAFRLDEEPAYTGLVPLNQWYARLGELQVGIAPLNDTRFNAAKSWLKMLEYAACGVACIGSPRAEYRKIHQLGVGLLAESPKDWYRLTKRLLDDESYRTSVAAASKAVVKESLTIETNAWRWAEAWSRALATERGALGVKTGR